eukprot:15353742-Ditylum_brightwellii.AAC.1
MDREERMAKSIGSLKKICPHHHLHPKKNRVAYHQHPPWFLAGIYLPHSNLSAQKAGVDQAQS